MYILAINSGSQTLKYKLYNKRGFELITEGGIKNIGFSEYKNHYQAITKVKEELNKYNDKIKLIGHRYVNGGEEFIDPEIMEAKKIKKIQKHNKLAPLHNPANLEGIKACQKIFKKAYNIAVFDTYYYKSLPKRAWMYAIDKKTALKYGYRRMGFHGISHQYVVNEAAKILKKDLKELKIISAHLGGGASITATKFTKAIDTSMGFTPAEGLVMMTRSGDLDPGIIIDLLRKGWKTQKIDDLINKKSGLFGLTGEKGMLEILNNLSDPKIKIAYDIYTYRIKKYIGAYFAALNGCDAIIFTGSVGSGKAITRVKIMSDMDFLKNTKVLSIPTNEELMIVQIALDVFKKNKLKIKK